MFHGEQCILLFLPFYPVLGIDPPELIFGAKVNSFLGPGAVEGEVEEDWKIGLTECCTAGG